MLAAGHADLVHSAGREHCVGGQLPWSSRRCSFTVTVVAPTFAQSDRLARSMTAAFRLAVELVG